MAAAVSLVGAVDLVRKVDSFRPLGFTHHAQGGTWEVDSVGGPGSGLRRGDRIVLVGGSDVSSAGDLRQKLLAAPTTELTLLRAGELVVVPYHRPGIRLDIPYLGLAGAGILYLIIGLYALLHSRRAPAGVFFLWSLASAAVYLCSPVSGAPPDPWSRRAMS
jgi:hypothetical protein